MKILYHHRIGSKDGQYVHVRELQRSLRSLGHELAIVEPEGFGERRFGADAGLASRLRQYAPGAVHELLEAGYALLDYRRLGRAIRRHRPECIYERYNLFTPSGAWAKRRFGLPMLVEVNAPLFEERSRYGGIFFRRLARWSERYVWRTADYVLPVTRVLAEYVEQAGVDPARIVVIGNGVNLEDFDVSLDGSEVRARFGLGEKLVLGFTGFVREWHGLDRTLDVVAAHGERLGLHLLVVGEGPGCDVLARRAEALGMQSSITLAGLVERSEIPRFVAAFDVALQPKVVDYASPLKILEYLAMEKAIVAPDTPNIREILADGENAVLFDQSREDAFADAVLRLCENEELRRRLGRQARQTVVGRRYTWDANARRVTDLFEALGARATGAPGTR